MVVDGRTLKHTITIFAMSDHYILSRECRVIMVIVDQVQTQLSW